MNAPSNSAECLQALVGRRVVSYLNGSTKLVVLDDGTALAFTGTFWREPVEELARLLLAERERLERKDVELERVGRLFAFLQGARPPEEARPQPSPQERAERLLVSCVGYSNDVVAAAAVFYLKNGVRNGSAEESLAELVGLLERSARDLPDLPDKALERIAAASEARRLLEDVRREGLA